MFGVAGRWIGAASRTCHIPAVAVLGGALIAEGINQVRLASDPTVGWGEIAVGLAATMVLGRPGERAATAVALSAAALLGLAAFVTFVALHGIATGA